MLKTRCNLNRLSMITARCSLCSAELRVPTGCASVFIWPVLPSGPPGFSLSSPHSLNPLKTSRVPGPHLQSLPGGGGCVHTGVYPAHTHTAAPATPAQPKEHCYGKGGQVFQDWTIFYPVIHPFSEQHHGFVIA